MSSSLLTWLAAGLIALVLASTLWLAHAIHPDQGHPALLVAQVAAPAASAPAATTTR